MDIGKSSAKSTLFLVVFVLLAIAALIFINISTLLTFYQEGDISKVGFIINGVIFGLFALGMLRMVLVLVRYIIQNKILFQLTGLLKENAKDPTARLPQHSMAVIRYKAVEWVTLIPKVTHSDDGMIRQVTLLTESLNKAADKVLQLEDNFMKIGDKLHVAVDDLQGKLNSNHLDDIKDLIRKGFHLSEPQYEAPQQKIIENPESDVSSIVDIETTTAIK